MEKCFRTDHDELKKLFKFTKKKDSNLQYLNLNFCFNLLRHTSFKRLMNDLSNKFKNLTEFHVLNSDSPNTCLDLNDLSKLAQNCSNLKCLSFNIASNLDENLNKNIKQVDLKNFSNLKSLKIEFKSTSLQAILDLIFIYSFNLTQLELYSADDHANFGLKLTKDTFPYTKLAYLEELCIGTTNITCDTSDYLAQLLNKLNHFSLNVSIDLKNVDSLASLIKHEKIVSVDLNFGIGLNYLRANEIVLNTNPYELDDLVKDYFNLDFSNKLSSIKLYIIAWPCILKTVNLNQSNCEYLNKLDLSSIHIHSHESTCKYLSDLKCNLYNNS